MPNTFLPHSTPNLSASPIGVTFKTCPLKITTESSLPLLPPESKPLSLFPWIFAVTDHPLQSVLPATAIVNVYIR